MRFPRIDLRARAENLVVSEGYTVVDFVKPNIELKDTYLMPIKVSNPQITFNTIPSNRHSQAWIPLAEACDVKGENPTRPDGEYLDNCAGKQTLDASRSTTISLDESAGLELQDNEANYYAKGIMGTEELVVGGDGAVVEREYGFGFATATNASFGVMGLGEDSALLAGMKKRGEIAARAFSLWMGADISYRQSWDRDARTGSFPGSLVLGGYDFKRELEGSKFLRGELKDGMPRVQITGINVHMPETQMMMDVGETVEAQIDSSVPWIHLPPPIATRMREVRENQVNDDGTLVRERRYGNITMTLRVLDEPTGGAREINVTFPESIWDQDYSYVWSPRASFKTFMPVLNRTETPALLGRAFLKAVYLAINYDTSEFQIAPAGYNSATETDIRPFSAVSVDGSNKALSFPTRVSGTKSTKSSRPTPNTPDRSEDTAKQRPVAAIAGGVLGALLGLCLLLMLILFCIKKRKKQMKERVKSMIITNPIPSNDPDKGFSDPRAGLFPQPRYGEAFTGDVPLTAELPETPHVAELRASGYGRLPEMGMGSPAWPLRKPISSRFHEMA